MIDTCQPKRAKPKRDIFRFTGTRPTAINLEHVTNMAIDEHKIVFSFYTHTLFVELESEDAAKLAFEHLLNIWAADVDLPQKEMNNIPHENAP